jgi:hypothetical protein
MKYKIIKMSIKKMSIKKINNINYFTNKDKFNITHHDEYNNFF